jgi:methylmalonic aciduria homocystinuria type C protein
MAGCSSTTSPHEHMTLPSRLAAVGLDLCVPVDPRAYDREIASLTALSPVTQPWVAGAWLVGNTAAMWPHFTAWWRDNDVDDPVDSWVEHVVSPTVGGQHAIHFAHDTGPGLVSMTRLAALAGLGDVSPSHMVVHPTHGPWLALRALILVDHATPSPTPAPSVCAGCAAPCMPALDAALALAPHGPAPGGIAHPDWRAWVAVRDACPVGHAHRYDEAQIAYHYARIRPR